jgi:hypothetical protein
MRWINGLGYVDIEHISKKLNIKSTTAYHRLRKLVLSEYIIYERIFYGRNGIYRVTSKGVKAAQDQVSAIRRVNLAKYEHDLIVVGISLELLKKYENANFIPERRLKHSLRTMGISSKGQHICDGVLAVNNKKIALEIELSSKGRIRRESIIKYYTKKFEYDEIWYICGNDLIKKQLFPLIQHRPFIKIFDLKSFEI